MKLVSNICGKCGAKIPDDTTREVCPACLLETGLGPLPDAPVVPQERDNCGTADSTEIPSKFGDFEIARREDGSLWELGHGGMGVTYRARDSVLHRSVALKVIEVPPGAGHPEVARERFLREARAAAALRHPNVAAVYHFGTGPDPDRCYYAMELVEGETLEARVRREGPLKVVQVLEIGAQVTRALIAATNQGLIHRDLKPGNIMLTRSEDSSAGFEVKVIDFGLAKITAESFGETDLTHGGFVGTPNYASPEQFAGGRVDARSDIYSLGASLWFALTAHLPCAGTNVEEIRRCQTEAPLPVQQLVARKVPAPVIALLGSMLAIDPEERPASARELMEAIEECRLKLTGGDEPTRRSFFAELQRRNVYKVAIAYAVVAWLLMQVASQIFPFFEIPNWVVRLVVLLLIIGFPVALIIAWAFESTPEGIKRTKVADAAGQRSRGGAWVYIVLIGTALSVGSFFLARHTASRKQAGPSELLAKSIAVLPFVNMSADKNDEYLSDGISEELITALSKITGLQVKARTSSFAFKGKNEDIRKIGELLHVSHLVEGSVAKAGKRLRISAQLIQASDGNHLWSDTYDREMQDIFAIRSDVAQQVVQALQVKLGVEETRALAQKPTENLKAFEYYIQAMSHAHRATREDLSIAIQYLEKALKEDPNYALAYAGLAGTYIPLGIYGYIAPIEARRKGEEIARKALTLDEHVAEAHVIVGAAYTLFSPANFSLGDRELRRAIELSPSLAIAHTYFGVSLARQGRLDESLEEHLKAREFDPLSPIIARQAAMPYYLKRDYSRALELLRQANELGPAFTTTWEIQVYIQNKLLNETLAELEKAKRERKSDSILIYDTGMVYAAQGKRAEALQIIKELEEMSGANLSQAQWIAKIYATLNEKEMAFSWLERGLAAGAITAFYKDEPAWDSIRGDSRFEELVEKMFLPPKAPAAGSLEPAIASEKSIAVLPFENLSRDPDNAYFAQGIQEEILTRLTSIADLRVISRTSTQRYQSKPPNLAEIAKQLGVRNILEGSVQKVADQVRVNVQLVNAQTDSHLWADTYDRKLTDIFGVESEIAKRVAESLQAKLTGHEEQAIAVKPTNNPEAYDAYLRGLAFEARSGFFDAATKTTIDSYERAVQLDPNFALAWARLSGMHARLYFTGADRTATRRDAAKSALDSAHKLQPNSPETLLALGYYQYWVLRDYGLAKSTFALVRKMLPNSSEVPMALSLITRREGHWDESIAYFGQALALDPRNTQLLNQAAGTYAALRQFPTAVKLYDRALDVLPNDPTLLAAKASIYQAEGKLEQAARFLSEITVQTPSEFDFIIKIIQLRLERNYAEAVRLLQARQAQFHFASEIEKAINQELLALFQRFAGDLAAAKATAEQARDTLEPLYKDQQDNAQLAFNLSVNYAIIGNKELALKKAERAVVLSASAKDRMSEPAFEEDLALIQTMVGENSRAISTLTQLLQTPYSGGIYIYTPVTSALLRLDPKWDPLRADPAFQKLCEEKQGLTRNGPAFR